ncbi:YdeI/OmpD-associated family protein [Tahibacter soli]|uniref:YdeI/OmpD-associated family protein n=1 Tax=Tahibacter soli TaxID=2983605 RepID=A0A9X3YKE5_9GAMM|nr:YdeI/OmpD-associated family protein [Tahibacter soli]MDC8013234.1 YdeI/OmpD-associated family protein [Tahibacter soli]
MKPTFFKTAADFGRWLARHYATETELLVGFWKRESGKPSMTWPESVDEALCVGWIDAVRRRIDDDSYTIRFTRRKPGSVWSAVNVAKIEALIAQGRVLPAGLAAYAHRKDEKTAIYAFEQKEVVLSAEFEALFRRNAQAWTFFEKQPAWFRKRMCWHVMSAKKDETRLKRLEKLIVDSERGVTDRERYRTPAKPRAAD